MTLDQFWINLIRKSPRKKLASANEKRNSANHYLDSENQIVQMTAKRINTVFCYMDSVKEFFFAWYADNRGRKRIKAGLQIKNQITFFPRRKLEKSEETPEIPPIQNGIKSVSLANLDEDEKDDGVGSSPLVAHVHSEK